MRKMVSECSNRMKGKSLILSMGLGARKAVVGLVELMQMLMVKPTRITASLNGREQTKFSFPEA
jgi:hypothetical protein